MVSIGLNTVNYYKCENECENDNTYKKIVGLGFKAKRVKNITKYNELFEGRVKTLHPIIHGGILFKRSDIKLAINNHFGSTLVEVKSYKKY